MKRSILAAVVGLAAFIAAPAFAGPYADGLNNCLAKSISAPDKAAAAQFVFAMMSANPAVSQMSGITKAERVAVSRRWVEVMQRLIFVDCRQQADAAVKFEGADVVQTSFGLLGNAALRGLMADPATQAELHGLGDYMDKARWTAFFKTAGATAQAPK